MFTQADTDKGSILTGIAVKQKIEIWPVAENDGKLAGES